MILITSTAFVCPQLPKFLTRQSQKMWLGIPFGIESNETSNSPCFSVNGLKCLLQAVTLGECTCSALLMSWLLHILGQVYDESWGGSDSAPRQKNWMKQFFPLPLYRPCDLCNSFGSANREVSELNQLASKVTVSLFLSSVIPRSRTILFQVEYTLQANTPKVKCTCSFSSTARTISSFSTRPRSHSRFRTLNSMGKNVQRITF